MITLLEVLQKSTRFLEERGVPDAKLSSEWILANALGLKRLDLYLQFERPLHESELTVIREGIKRRSKREPLQYILGSTEFYGLSLKSDPRALIPRPETEYLVELLHTQLLNCEPKRILDLGTGSGAIIVALLNVFPGSEGVAVDSSEAALALANENASMAGVSDRLDLFQSDWFENVEGVFDLIISNPPYLTDEEMATAEPEVSHFEPHSALSGGEDGLRDLNRLIDQSYAQLVEGGLLVLETGISHHKSLIQRAKAVGYASSQPIQDLQKRDRFLLLLR